MSRINPLKRPAALPFDSARMEAAIGSPEWLGSITRVAQSVGKPEFEQRLYHLLTENLHIDQVVVFTYSGTDAPDHLFTRGKMPQEQAEVLAHDYVNKYYVRDPQRAFARGTVVRTTVTPVHPRLADEYDPEYRRHFFSDNDLIDKISTVASSDGGNVYCNFYRMGDSGPYSATEQELLNGVLPLITSLISTHFTLARLNAGLSTGDDSNVARSLVHSVISRRAVPFDRLTAREAEICERILVGYTSTGISLDLGIATSSVNTYRRRAYEKLGISTQNELFSLCLEALNRIRA